MTFLDCKVLLAVEKSTVKMATKSSMPELKKFMDKQLVIKMNGGRTVAGVLRGYDVFMNASF